MILILNSNDSKLITQYHLLVGQIAKSEKEFSKAFDNFKLAEGNKAIKDVLKSELNFFYTKFKLMQMKYIILVISRRLPQKL